MTGVRAPAPRPSRTWPPPSPVADERRLAVRDRARRPSSRDLPLRYWRQQAHLTTPAADAAMARKAVEGGTAPMAPDARAVRRDGAPTSPIGWSSIRLVDEAGWPRRRRAPLVMLDGEDALAPGDAVAARGLAVAADTLADADWGSAGGPAALRFYRPPGLNLETTVRDLYALLWGLRERSATPGRFPLDGIVFPKVEHPEEVDLVHDLLDRRRGRARAAAGPHPGRLPRGIGLGGGPAAGDRAARRAPPVPR